MPFFELLNAVQKSEVQPDLEDVVVPMATSDLCTFLFKAPPRPDEP
jgi:hypothetical protein